jgi:tRNA threonylcarbamoyladenosine biosynthesis protein TsaB
MTYILHMDTSQDTASVCLTKDEKIIQILYNKEKNDHAAWLHVAADRMMKTQELKWEELKAVSVCMGPGSYTGLRIGMSAAKGFCYALKIPLLTAGSLHMQALAARNGTTGLIIPLIDARRMEVYMAIYNDQLKELFPPQAMILDENSFTEQLAVEKILFCGSGAEKLKRLIRSPNAFYSDIPADASHLSILAREKYQEKDFTDISGSGPIYLKEFFTGKIDRPF